MTSWVWFDQVGERPADAAAAAAATDARTGEPAGFLAVWDQRRRPTRTARRIDARVVDPAGAAAAVSLVRTPESVRILFDDLAVQQARRDTLARVPFDAVTTLLSDASHFEGALTVARNGGAARLADDPFARIFPARVLHVGAGLFGTLRPPAGPTIERYGSARPWPWDRFADE